MTTYPPEQHMLRDLRFSFEHDTEGRQSRAWMPVVEELCNDAGYARAGALATLVDVIGGGLAAAAAAPDWIATADLTLHAVGPAWPGTTVQADARVLRAGRTTVVIEVALTSDDRPDRRDVGIATMSFSVLPRRDANPDMSSVRGGERSTMATEASRLAVPLPEALGVVVRDAACGDLDVPVTDWVRNSMGAMQGGIVATVADLAAETALRAAAPGASLVVADLQVTYLGFGRVGPVRTHAEVLHADTTSGAARVELVDAGAEARVMTSVSVVATAPFERHA